MLSRRQYEIDDDAPAARIPTATKTKAKVRVRMNYVTGQVVTQSPKRQTTHVGNNIEEEKV